MGRQRYDESLKRFTLPAAPSDQSANQFKVVSGLGALVTSAGAGGVGILQNRPIQGEPESIGFAGLSIAISGGTVTAGSKVTNDTAGKIVNAATGNTPIGWAVTGTSNADEYVTILVVPGGGQLN